MEGGRLDSPRRRINFQPDALEQFMKETQAAKDGEGKIKELLSLSTLQESQNEQLSKVKSRVKEVKQQVEVMAPKFDVLANAIQQMDANLRMQSVMQQQNAMPGMMGYLGMASPNFIADAMLYKLKQASDGIPMFPSMAAPIRAENTIISPQFKCMIDFRENRPQSGKDQTKDQLIELQKAHSDALLREMQMQNDMLRRREEELVTTMNMQTEKRKKRRKISSSSSEEKFILPPPPKKKPPLPVNMNRLTEVFDPHQYVPVFNNNIYESMLPFRTLAKKKADKQQELEEIEQEAAEVVKMAALQREERFSQLFNLRSQKDKGARSKERMKTAFVFPGNDKKKKVQVAGSPTIIGSNNGSPIRMPGSDGARPPGILVSGGYGSGINLYKADGEDTRESDDDSQPKFWAETKFGPKLMSQKQYNAYLSNLEEQDLKRREAEAVDRAARKEDRAKRRAAREERRAEKAAKDKEFLVPQQLFSSQVPPGQEQKPDEKVFPPHLYPHLYPERFPDLFPHIYGDEIRRKKLREKKQDKELEEQIFLFKDPRLSKVTPARKRQLLRMLRRAVKTIKVFQNCTINILRKMKDRRNSDKEYFAANLGQLDQLGVDWLGTCGSPDLAKVISGEVDLNFFANKDRETLALCQKSAIKLVETAIKVTKGFETIQSVELVKFLHRVSYFKPFFPSQYLFEWEKRRFEFSKYGFPRDPNRQLFTSFMIATNVGFRILVGLLATQPGKVIAAMQEQDQRNRLPKANDQTAENTIKRNIKSAAGPEASGVENEVANS